VKRLFHSGLFAFALICGVSVFNLTILSGCKTSQQRIAYNTLHSVQTVTVGAYDGYIAAIISKKIPGDDLPAISRKFDTFQAAFRVALDAVQYNTNALAPDNLTVISGDLINLINAVTPKSK
jgi:hypothetical protein